MLSFIISGSHMRFVNVYLFMFYCGVMTIVNKVFIKIWVQIILEFGSSWAWMPKTDAYLTTKMLRILVKMRPACGVRVLMVSTLSSRVEYL